MPRGKAAQREPRGSRINVGLDPTLRQAIETIADAHQTTMSGVIFELLDNVRDQIIRYARRIEASKREKENLRRQMDSLYTNHIEEIERITMETADLNVRKLNSEEQIYLLEIREMSKKLKSSLEKSRANAVKK